MAFNQDIAIYDLPNVSNGNYCDLSWFNDTLYWISPIADKDTLYLIDPTDGSTKSTITLDWTQRTTGIAVVGIDEIWLASSGYFVKFNSSGTKLYQSSCLLSMFGLCWDSVVGKLLTNNQSSPYGLYYFTKSNGGSVARKCDSPYGFNKIHWCVEICGSPQTFVAWYAPSVRTEKGGRFWGSDCSTIAGTISRYSGVYGSCGVTYDSTTGYLWSIDMDGNKIFAKDCGCTPTRGGASALPIFAKMLL